MLTQQEKIELMEEEIADLEWIQELNEELEEKHGGFIFIARSPDTQTNACSQFGYL